MTTKNILCIGVDPDSGKTGICFGLYDVKNQTRYVHSLGFVENKERLKGADKVVDQITSAGFVVDQMYNEFVLNQVALGDKVPVEIVLCVENQDISFQRTKKPESILMVAQVAGGIISAVDTIIGTDAVYFPRPVTWKGSVPKDIFNERIIKAWQLPKMQPTSRGTSAGTTRLKKDPRILYNANVTDNQWKSCWSHVLDAAGLCLYGMGEHLKQRKIKWN